MSINNDQSFRDNNNSFILNPNNEEDSVLSNIRKIFQTNENNSFIFSDFDDKTNNEQCCDKNESINNENKTIKNEGSINYIKKNKKEVYNKNLTIIRYINRLIEIYKNKEKLETSTLFNIIEFLKRQLSSEMKKLMGEGNNISNVGINRLLKILDIIDLLKEIEELEIKEKNEGISDKKEIIFLKVKIILYEEENEGDKEIKNKIELANLSEPIEELNFAIKIFIFHLLKDAIKYYELLIREENESNKSNKKEIKITKSLGKKTKKQKKHSFSETQIKHKKLVFRDDNYQVMLKRNLIQKIFLDWINNEETNKNNKLIKIDPEIFRHSYDFRGKKLKEIYSEPICLKEKYANKNHNIQVIEKAKGIKNIKLNFTFEQALNLFYNKAINNNEIMKIIRTLQENEKIIDEIDIIKGLKVKEEFILEKSKNKDSKFRKGLDKNLLKLKKNFLGL